jgi:hypothetical protein
MKPSPSKTMKATGGKKGGREEAAGSAAGTSPPVSPPRPDPNHEWKKSKVKTEDLLALLNSGFLREKEVEMWRAAVGDPYPMEKNSDEMLMFSQFAEHELSLPVSDFFKGATRVLRHRVPQPQPQRYLPHRRICSFLRSLPGDQAPLDLVPEVLPGEASTQH